MGSSMPAVTSSDAIRVLGVSHAFKGGKKALNRVSFSVAQQSIHGFVGPNGAGKTTTLKLIATLMQTQPGSRVEVFGHNVSTEFRQVRRLIGFMPDHLSMYRRMTVEEYLDFFGAAYGLPAAERDRILYDVLALTDMTSRRYSLISSLSRGMQQRVSLARVLVHDPKLLLLDEPASGLDPRARIELMEILRALREMGKTIFISSHILSELADLCDSVTIIDRGEIRFTGALSDLLAGGEGGRLTAALSLEEAHPACLEALEALDGVEAVEALDEETRYRITYNTDALEPNHILQAALASGARVAGWGMDRKHLNQAFLDLTTPGVGG